MRGKKQAVNEKRQMSDWNACGECRPVEFMEQRKLSSLRICFSSHHHFFCRGGRGGPSIVEGTALEGEKRILKLSGGRRCSLPFICLSDRKEVFKVCSGLVLKQQRIAFSGLCSVGGGFLPFRG